MAAGKTENLGLCQWAREDYVKLADFNEDNGKIDKAVAEAKQAAIAAEAANPWVKLLDVTTTISATTVELNLSSINLSNYLSLRVYQITTNGSSIVYTRMNKLASYYATCSNITGGGGFSQEDGTVCVVSGSWFDIDILSGYFYLFGGVGGYRVSKSRTGSKLNTIDMLNDYSGAGAIPAGTRYIILGVRR